MTRPQIVGEAMDRIKTVGNLSHLFQSISSIEIARIKQKTVASQHFFEELWHIYTALRVSQRNPEKRTAINKKVFIIITAEGGFSGDIDEKLIRWMLERYDPKATDIICIGHHGAIKLAQLGVEVVRYFKLPSDKDPSGLSDIVALVETYESSTVFYQNYVSLSIQDVKSIDLQKAVKQLEPQATVDPDLISEASYIFEPPLEVITAYLESTMLTIALAQVILDSKLAQHASRFSAMSAAKERSNELYKDLRLDYYRARRLQADEGLKEIMSGLHRVRTKLEQGI